MKEIGSMGMLRATANSFTSMVMFTKAIGGMIRPMATAPINMLMGRSMKASGRTTCSMVKAKNLGLTVQYMKDIMKMVRNMELAIIHGTMGRITTEIGAKTKSADLVLTHGLMDASTLASGKKITWKVLAYILGQTVENIKAGTETTKRVAMEYIPGQMDANTTENGPKANNTVLECTKCPQKPK